MYCLSTYTYYTSHVVAGRAEKQGRSKQTQHLEIWGFLDHSSYSWCSLTGFFAAKKLDIWIPQKPQWKSSVGVSPSRSVTLWVEATAFRAETTQQLVQAFPDNLRAQCTNTTSTISFLILCVLSSPHNSASSQLRGDLNFSDEGHNPVLCHCAHTGLPASRYRSTQPTHRPCWVLLFLQQHLFQESPTTGPITISQKSNKVHLELTSITLVPWSIQGRSLLLCLKNKEMATILFRWINLYFSLWFDSFRTNQTWAKKMALHGHIRMPESV